MGDKNHFNEGAALKAHRIAFSTRKLAEVKLSHPTGAHRGTTGTLVGNSYCIIETPLQVYTDAQAKKQRGGSGKRRLRKPKA